MEPHLPSLDDFVRQVANGDIHIGELVPMSYPRGDRTEMVTFPTLCAELSKRDQIPMLPLLRTIQKGVHGNLLHRMNRSPIFRGKIQEVMKPWSTDDPVQLFEDRVSRPYEYPYYHTEYQREQDLRRRLQEIEGSLSEADESYHGPLDDIISECQTGKRHLQTQAGILQENHGEYEPRPGYERVVRDLGMQPPSFYRTSMKDQTNPAHLAHTGKQIQKWVPPNIQHIFGNHGNLPILLMHENARQSQHVHQLHEMLQASENSAHTIKQSLPSPTSIWDDFTKFFVTPSEYESETDTDEDDLGTLEHTLQKMADSGPAEAEDEAPAASEAEAEEGDEEDEGPAEEDEEDEEDEGEDNNAPLSEEENEQRGGKYYMELNSKNKTSSFF